MTENLLTKEEIVEVLVNAKSSPELKDPNIISIGKEKTSIYKISPQKEIIFIRGNSYTGFIHINERHSFWSENYFWIKNEEKIKLDNPSKFNEKSIPIVDYVKIADALYSVENLNPTKNKDPELFEMYSGVVLDEHMKYHMLIYKGTKIIHTLFPHKKMYNKKKIIDFKRGNPNGKLLLNSLCSIITVPYLDENDIVVYSFQIIKDFAKEIETGVLISHKLNKTFHLYERIIEEVLEFHIDVERMRTANLLKIEQAIKELQNEQEKNNSVL